MTTATISQVKRDISQLINRVTYGSERIVLTSRGRPKAALVSMDDLRHLEALGNVRPEQSRRTTADEVRARRMATLEQARLLREQIAARAGGPLPDSAQELNDLREERDEQLLRLR